MKRAVAKGLTYKCISITVAALIIWALTGSIKIALEGLVLISPVTFVLYIIHEKVWDKIDWGKK